MTLCCSFQYSDVDDCEAGRLACSSVWLACSWPASCGMPNALANAMLAVTGLAV